MNSKANYLKAKPHTHIHKTQHTTHIHTNTYPHIKQKRAYNRNLIRVKMMIYKYIYEECQKCAEEEEKITIYDLRLKHLKKGKNCYLLRAKNTTTTHNTSIWVEPVSI